MHCKKNETQPNAEGEDPPESTPLNWAWVIYCGVKLLGYPEKEVWEMTLVKWLGLYGEYKKEYNFAAQHGLYRLEENPEGQKVSSLLDL